MLKFFAIFLLSTVCVVARHTSRSVDNYETDSIIDYLLNGYLTEDEDVTEKSHSSEVPVFKDGIWKYGTCDNIENSKPTYSEYYEIEKDKSINEPVVLQVMLSAENMRCITISADSSSMVVKEACSIKRSSVTFSVSNSYQFIVHVY